MKHVIFALAILVALCFVGSSTRAQTAAGWPTAKPASVGLDEKAIAALDADIKSGKYGNVDSLTIIRHGKLVFNVSYPHDYAKIYEKEMKTPDPLNACDPSGPYDYYNSWWHPYYRRGGDIHTLQSVSKTITSITIGVARLKGDFPDIDTPVLNFFDTSKVANIDDRKRKMTIRNLLTMSAGFDWNEDLPYQDPKNTGTQMEMSNDWVAYTINRPMAHDPGTTFQYNSGASEILSHIFRVAVGMDVEEYAAKNLFAPLGITNYYWKRAPGGLPDTEGGVYLNPRDLAKLWYLFLKNGVWNGKQIVSPEWVKDSLTPHMHVGPPTSGVNYGLKWWLYSYGKDSSNSIWAGSGFGGQLPWAFPQYDMVTVVTSWNINTTGPRMTRRELTDRILAMVKDPAK
ncbi:MAG TPA: serine hydrolase [Pyrinomonadaceae bacterium]|jgi:CubicO group peptidase (beta-lactamase class C family)